MKTFPSGIQFKYSWRNYQQRVLEELESHLSDQHLHIVAPPGAGKTVLGLEVALRINQPTLILAPTIAIRNQWIQRFCELFLQTNDVPDWISRSIHQPAFLTVVTYQGLHAACSGSTQEEVEEPEEESDDNTEEKSPNDSISDTNLDTIANGLKKSGIATIVVDEAHHLKNEWWQTLNKIKTRLNPIIVGLTATPPYDVTVSEWQRYIELNGPVDAEISVPELVVEGDLCPHQDYIFFTLPAEDEKKRIEHFREKITILFQQLKSDTILIEAIESHPIYTHPSEHLETIYNNLSFYSSILIYLHANSIKINDTHLEIIGDKNLIIPQLDHEWLKVLLECCLYKEDSHFKQYAEHFKSIEQLLRRNGAIERKQINFSQNNRIAGLLISSISKLNAIVEIVDFEYNQLGHGLRMVILSDFIRKEFFVNAAENTVELNKMGVIPIFERLRRENRNHKKLGILSGSLIVIPASAYTAFEQKAQESGITKIHFTPVPFDEQYLIIQQTDQLKHDIVHIVTHIFQEGHIEILIGTKSLLGEGWDAPAINSLILASFVGSFVLSNQMRGRAIRTVRNNQHKTGTIWHLVCLDPTTALGGEDYAVLKRRFKSFVGISLREHPGIENGIGRLNLPKELKLQQEVDQINQVMFRHAADRQSIKQQWDVALKSGFHLTEEIKLPFAEKKTIREIKTLYFTNTIKNLIAMLVSGFVAFGMESVGMLARIIGRVKKPAQLFAILTFLGIIGLLFFGRSTYKTLRLYIKYRDISKDIRPIAEALLLALIEAGIVHTKRSELRIEASVDKNGAVYCHLSGGTTFEKSTFINALYELITPVNNPKYVLIRKSRSAIFTKQEDFHAVPELLAKNKKLAEYFQQQWEKHVGDCELIYTRSIDGRKLLLKSRVESLSAQFDHEVEQVNKWR